MKNIFDLASKTYATLERAVRIGSLTVTTPDGMQRVFAGPERGPAGVIVINDWRTLGAALSQGDIGLGNAYMAGWWDSPDLEPLFSVLMLNMDGLGKLAWGTRLHRITSVFREWVMRRNSLAGSRRNIMAHYDVGNDFYAAWLDPSMTYSCAMYASPQMDLATGQQAKYARILDRLGGNHGEILEIGCGWGGFMAAASGRQRRVTALTISRQQHAFVRERAGSNADVRLQDYRASSGRYPGIVSIEMFEAVGERYWPAYFATLRERLTKDGVAIVQTISIADQLFASYRTSSDYVRHYIFPGGLLPSVARFREEAEHAGLAVTDVHSFGQDYARTCREWLGRFDASAPRIAALGYDAGFMRGWRMYLAMCASGFAYGRTNVHQIELRHASA